MNEWMSVCLSKNSIYTYIFIQIRTTSCFCCINFLGLFICHDTLSFFPFSIRFFFLFFFLPTNRAPEKSIVSQMTSVNYLLSMNHRGTSPVIVKDLVVYIRCVFLEIVRVRYGWIRVKYFVLLLSLAPPFLLCFSFISSFILYYITLYYILFYFITSQVLALDPNR